ncbi:NADH-quinone oxidoreductase subunit C [Streptomyces sp. BE147]|uniref:NADH-quinone oxidoreductase subunit C n=1 Tax=Streptomyces sp. BE147 TaxID=3002524 RepID=UPI002E761D7A|nr:NADH-quinone oxidoreductase subunit C [Streptomyces sp. BE147]MEE1735686.1 NADH-quinone oxidoreductase subunit C [Streptomyces sp. BE147]
MPDAVTEIFGADATAERAYDLLTVDVPAASWIDALETARDRLGCGYFDWLSAVDEPGTGFRVCAHVAAPRTGTVRRLLIRTTVPHEAPVLPSAIGVYAGAEWHERETHEMFGIGFEGHPHLVPLLLPEGFEGHPLRKDFVLAARVAKAWPGAKEPGESEHGGPKRRTMLPPGVPDPNEWGPLKGQLPPAPSRPARGARAAAGDRPVRRARSASEGSAAQRAATGTAAADPAAGAAGESATPAAPVAPAAPAARPRRSRSVSEGSASQQRAATPPAPEPDTASGQDTGAGPSTASAQDDTASAPGATPPRAPRPPRSTDAPWHDARPAFDDTDGGGAGTSRSTGGTPAPEHDAEPDAEPDPGTETRPDRPDQADRPDRPAGGDSA